MNLATRVVLVAALIVMLPCGVVFLLAADPTGEGLR